MFVILLVLINLINLNESSKCLSLVLTPFIESNRLVEAKRLSSVTALHDFQDIRSYSGFLTVNKKYDSNLFFWFFPSQKNHNAPVILWLNGGPGGTSLFGLFIENGPFRVNESLHLVRNMYSWTQDFSVIYIDNPVGVGFSHTNSSEGFARNERKVANNLYEGLQQFFKIFSEYRKNDFYLTGESYAGKYIPAIGYKLHQMSDKSNINFKGIAIGNAWIDPITQLDTGSFLYQIGLIDEIQSIYFQETNRKTTIAIKNKDFRRAYLLYTGLMGSDISSESYFSNVTGYSYFYNFLKLKNPNDPLYFVEYLNKEKVQNALHVGCPQFSFYNPDVEKYLIEDYCDSVKPWFKVLIENYKVLLYTGQLDIILNTATTENFLKNLVWKYSNEYFNAKRIIWRIDDEVVGYVKRVANFTRVVVRKAGHELPQDQPRVALEMIKKFINSHPFN